MGRNNKLELTWVGKEDRPRLEPRILVEDPELSYAAASKTDGDIFDNRLIQGDNLLALKALEADYTGSVKCVYIDPPFNTGQAFEHYDDSIEHSLWLSLMRDRLFELHNLLSDEGSIWVHIDDNEVHRIRCLLDELFGPYNFVGNVIWEKSDSPRMDAQFFSVRHDYIIVYAKDKNKVMFNRLMETEAASHYDKIDSEGRKYYLKPLRAMGGQGETREARPNLYFAMVAPDGTNVFPKRQDGSDGAWRWSRDKVEAERWRVDWVKGRAGWTPYYRIFADISVGRPPETIWPHGEVGSNRTSKAEAKSVVPDQPPFDTPKPERLIQKIIEIATEPNDLVLDSFAGSGTTGAVAHKLGRRWIMVESGRHATSHVLPRLRKVVDGIDAGGITKSSGWVGGGGFRFDRLAPSLLVKDRWGNWIISKEYNPAMLAEAMCKHMGFAYAPAQDPLEYWRHGHSSERDFLFVTTHALTHDMLAALSYDVGPDRHLLICCKAFSSKQADKFENLTLVRIPQAILTTCEWGRDDYSLRIANLPSTETQPNETALEPNPKPKHGSTARAATARTLFDPADNEA